MHFVTNLMELSGTLIIALGVGVGLVALLAFIKKFLYICPPNEVLIFSGQQHKNADGSTRGFRVIFGGRGWRVPLLETVHRMPLTIMEIPISIRSAYSKGGIPLNVDAIANVKISSNRGLIGNAIERFLGQSTAMIARVAKETLEGHLRGVLATLTPEEVNEDRLKFADSLAKESAEDFAKLGLHVDTLKIQNVSDESQYLNSIGRKAIANVVRDAEMAESDAKREAEESEADNRARANVTKANAEASIARMTNDLRRIQAELDSTVKSEFERTEAAAREARAVAEQELQTVRAALAEIRLHTDEVLPADAQRVADELTARGRAAIIRERGQAVGRAMDVINQAWAQAGQDAMAIYLIEDFEKLIKAAAKGVSKIQVDHVSMIDSGDGKALSSYVAAYPAMLSAIFDAVAKTTGIDIPKIVSGDATTTEIVDRSRSADEATTPGTPAS